MSAFFHKEKRPEPLVFLFFFRSAIKNEFSCEVIEYHREGRTDDEHGDPGPEHCRSSTGEDLREFKSIEDVDSPAAPADAGHVANELDDRAAKQREE